MFVDFLQLLLHYGIIIIPPFLIALLVSAVIVEYLPDRIYEKVLSSHNFLVVVFVSIIGALIPICTCGMIPLASKLHKKGASWLVVVSFLTAGNASSITALLMTLVLGFGITLLRFIFAVVFGLFVAYVFVFLFKPKSLLEKSCEIAKNSSLLPMQRVMSEFISLVKSFGPWVVAAIVIGAFISLFLSAQIVTDFAGVKNPFAPFIFGLIGFPFYFCGGADIPISKSLLDKGAGLGSILSFMTASPGVNLTTLFVYQKWLGVNKSVIYLITSVIVCGTLGSVINFFMLPISP